jgi:GntR family transcriptional regulator, transcriptional repressor for pyruvate dehydrogenase complex
MVSTETPSLGAAQIQEILERDILSGLYPTGARLPTEAALCARFEVSRPKLREVLGRLSARGLIETRRGAQGGTFVAAPALETALAQLPAALVMAQTDPAMLRDALMQLQGACIRLICLTPGIDLHDIRAEIDVQSDFSLTDADFRASCKRMHLGLCALSGNALLAALTGALIEAIMAKPAGEVPVRERARYLSLHLRLANTMGAGQGEDALLALAELHAFEEERLAPPQAPPAPEMRPEPVRGGLRLPRRMQPVAGPFSSGNGDYGHKRARNKRIGPGGGTRRLHQNPHLGIMGPKQDRRTSKGVMLCLGEPPPLSVQNVQLPMTTVLRWQLLRKQ